MTAPFKQPTGERTFDYNFFAGLAGRMLFQSIFRIPPCKRTVRFFLFFPSLQQFLAYLTLVEVRKALEAACFTENFFYRLTDVYESRAYLPKKKKHNNNRTFSPFPALNKLKVAAFRRFAK